MYILTNNVQCKNTNINVENEHEMLCVQNQRKIRQYSVQVNITYFIDLIPMCLNIRLTNKGGVYGFIKL